MKTLQKYAVLIQLIDELKNNGSWCGETHIQKAAYFLQELVNVPIKFDFILYKHGPFSFGLRDFLNELRADGLIQLVPQSYPYGPSFSSTEMSGRFKDNFKNTLSQYKNSISFVANALGNKGVAKLEQLSTALYISKKMGIETEAKTRAHGIIKLKPFLSFNQAFEAVKEVDEMIPKLPS